MLKSCAEQFHKIKKKTLATECHCSKVAAAEQVRTAACADKYCKYFYPLFVVNNDVNKQNVRRIRQNEIHASLSEVFTRRSFAKRLF